MTVESKLDEAIYWLREIARALKVPPTLMAPNMPVSDMTEAQRAEWERAYPNATMPETSIPPEVVEPLSEVVIGPGGEHAPVDSTGAPARGYDVQRPPGFVPLEYLFVDDLIAAEVDRYHPRSKWHEALQAELPDTVAGKAEFGRRLGRAAEINGFVPALRIDYRAEAGQYMTDAQYAEWLRDNPQSSGSTNVGPT